MYRLPACKVFLPFFQISENRKDTLVAHAVTGQFFTPFSGNEQEHPTAYGNIGIQAYLFGKLDVRVQRIHGKYVPEPPKSYAVFADRYADISEGENP